VERHPETRRRLHRPVVSIGNLSVGGTGKTPVVSALARWLVDRGERPAILSRGYKRRDARPGVEVVADGRGVLVDVSRAGDEPLMLARAVPGAIVCVAEDRHLAGVVAERLGATVHLLDDGFQHLSLAREVDILVTTAGEIPNGRVLPRGRLREPADAASRADFLIVMGATSAEAEAEARLLGVAAACAATRHPGSPRAVFTQAPGTSGPRDSQTPGRKPQAAGRVLLLAAIANPSRFANDVRAAGWHVVGEAWFADHHAFTEADIARIAARITALGADVVFTTEKDAVRLEALDAPPFPLYAVPVTLAFDPASSLYDRLTTLLTPPSEGHR
jgi:tetraacyldisaccharide 4'-kinase